MGAPSWEDVKKVVDDPSVPHDQKKALLEAYYVADAEGNILGGTHNDELEEYLDDYDVSWGDGFGQSFSNAMPWSDSSEDRLNNAYDQAKKSYDDGHKKYDQHNQDKKAGQDALAGSEQRASDGGAGVGNSNDLLDAGKPGLRYFENFLPVYEKAKSVIGVGTTVDTSVDNMRKRYDEQRDIDFHKIDIDIVELRQVATDTRNRQADAERSMGKVWANWTGASADNSRRVVTDMSRKAAAHADAIDHIAEVTRATCHTVSGLVNTKARTILEGVGSVYDIAGLSPEQIEQVVQGATSDDESLLRRVAGFVNFQIDDGACDGDVWKEEVRKKSREWLQTTFHGDVDSKWKLFDETCKTTKESVDKAWEELGKQLDAFNTKPFDPAKEEQPADKPSDKPGNTGGGDKPGGGGGTPGGGGGTPGGGGGTPGGGGGGTPEIPKVENPLDKDGDGKPDMPGDLDGDGKPDDLDGDGKADTPDGLKSGDEAPETVTIHSGDNEIKVTEPDADGQVMITVDTPAGEPKTYQVDFSANPDAAKALMGQNGAAALAGALGGATPVSAAGTPGAQPVQAGGAGPGEVTQVQAGADGKALIEVDGLAITAEVDPLTGEINLTVDDGDGSPERYGVEFGEDEPARDLPGDLGRPDAAVLGPAVVESSVTTMPADADVLGPAVVESPVTTMPADADVLGPAAVESPVTTMPADAAVLGPAVEQVWTQPAPAFTEPGFAPVADANQGFTPPQGFAPVQDFGPGQGFAPGQGHGPGQGFAPGQGFGPSFGEPLVASSDDSGVTRASGASIFGGSSGFNGADSVLGGSSASGQDSPWSPPSSAAEQGLADTNASQAGQAGSATLPSMQDGTGQPAGSPAGGGMMGGGMMGGGMAGGGHQQGGGDTERSSSSGQWRTTGSLFDDDDVSMQRLSGLLGEDRR
ncbi:hypothetical protein [Saccharothrix syringae]|uniref:hypothetical protein n=1 Tax=Saccharothrix syringae TaxID=103733 RepID=UPI000525830A|nr:hypothetical protein [Saccharothrix syringae]